MKDITITAEENVFEASLDLGCFLEKHGRGLFDLMSIVTDREFEIMCDLENACRHPVSEPEGVILLLDKIVSILAAQKPSVLQEKSKVKRICLQSANAWYGARLTDFLSLIRRRHAVAKRATS